MGRRIYHEGPSSIHGKSCVADWRRPLLCPREDVDLFHFGTDAGASVASGGMVESRLLVQW